MHQTKCSLFLKEELVSTKTYQVETQNEWKKNINIKSHWQQLHCYLELKIKTLTAFQNWHWAPSSAVHHMDVKTLLIARLLYTYIILYNLTAIIWWIRGVLLHPQTHIHWNRNMIFWFQNKVCSMASQCGRQMVKAECIIDLSIKCSTCWECWWMVLSGGREKQWPSVPSFTPLCPPILLSNYFVLAN